MKKYGNLPLMNSYQNQLQNPSTLLDENVSRTSKTNKGYFKLLFCFLWITNKQTSFKHL